MGIEVNNNLDKSTLIDLYESALKDNKNKLKIISQLRKDTDNINSKLAMSQRQSLPHNIISSNISKNKAMNISYEVKPLNSREQIINIVKPIHTNKGQYTQNPFTSSSMNQKQNINLANFSNVNIFPNSLDKNYNYEATVSMTLDTGKTCFSPGEYVNGSISLKPKYVDKSPFPTIQVFNTFFPSPNLFKRTGGLERKFSSLTIKETKDIKSPPTLPTKAIIEPIAKDNIISIAKTFHNI